MNFLYSVCFLRFTNQPRFCLFCNVLTVIFEHVSLAEGNWIFWHFPSRRFNQSLKRIIVRLICCEFRWVPVDQARTGTFHGCSVGLWFGKPIQSFGLFVALLLQFLSISVVRLWLICVVLLLFTSWIRQKLLHKADRWTSLQNSPHFDHEPLR